MAEPADLTASPDAQHEGFLSLVRDTRDAKLAPEDFLQKAGELLEGLPLYPATRLLQIGDAAGELLEKHPAAAIDLALRLVSSPYREIRAVAAVVIHRLARYQPGLWVDTTKHLARDEDWEVRDMAAHIFDTMDCGEGAADFHLAFVKDTVEDWIEDEDYLLRRAGSQALLGYAAKHPEFRAILLEMLEPLLEDDLEYIRRSHAAALRALGRMDPAAVLDYIEGSLDTLTETSRETFRLVLEHSFADRLPERKKAILARL